MFRCILSLLLAAICLVGRAGALPPDFEITEFVGGLRDPATMAFAPDGRLLVGERITGKIRVVTGSGQVLATPFLTLDVPPVRHRSGGVRGFAFDPAFPAEPYVYVFYTKQFSGDVRHNRVSRFTVSAGDANTADPASELVLLELPFNSSALGSSGSHNGGAVVFGGDGKLYVTTGDGWNDSNGYGAGDSVQSLSSFTGKIFRINRDGTIPTDNPFYSQASGDYRAIYALGFRNPFAAAVHPVSGEVFVFDVGTANGNDKDHIFKVAAGENYGHDGYGGIGTAATTWAKAGTKIVSGGTWYFADRFPAAYRGRLFVTSWKQGLKTVGSLTDTTVADFGSADVNDQGPVYPCVGPDGSIYFLESTYETSDGKVFKLSYTNANLAPSPTISPNGGSFVDSVEVSLVGDAVRYTTDGSEPTVASSLYVNPFTLSAAATVKARSFASGFDPSPVVSAFFEVVPGEAPAFANSLPEIAQLSETFSHTAMADGVPAPQFSLDVAPPGMTVNPGSGEIFWVPQEAGEVAVSLRASNGTAPDAVQSLTITVGNFLAAADPDPSLLTVGGLRFSYFEDSSKAVAEGVTGAPGVEIRQRDDDFRIRFEGFLDVPSSDDYQLFAVTGDEVRVLVGGTEVIGSAVALEAGLHQLVVEYTEVDGPQDLELRWSSGAIAEQAVPVSALRYFTTPYGIFSRRALPGYLGSFPQDESGAIPSTLSSTGAFLDLGDLEVAQGVVPYEPNAKLWSDGADKLRWIALPTGAEITFTETGSWEFPAGTVFIKHFEIGEERRRIETRFEIVKEGGSSYLVTYRWREDQSDADLVPVAGDSGLVSFDGKQQEWFFPSRAQCVACHNSSVNYVLGANTRQLNGVLDFDSGVTDNQLRTWSHLGMIDSVPEDLAVLDELVEIDAVAEPLEKRVRSYLDANCAYCHNSNAAPEGTNFVLEYDVPLLGSGLLGALPSQDLGLGALARVIAPRDPKYSTLFHRVAGNEPATRMPPVGRTIVHEEAREALVEWILSLDAANTLVDVTDYSRRWSFDGNTGDGTWRDGVEAPTYLAGKVGQALSFDGVDDAVDLGPLDVPSGDGLTIAFWFKADDFGTTDARFLSKADGQFDEDHYWMVSTLNSTKLRFRMRAGGKTTNLISDAGTIEAGVWTHVVARYDGSTMKIFKDGVEVASVAKSGALDASGTVDAAIGNQPTTATGGARPFDGLIDEMRIYPRALTATEIITVRDAADSQNAAPLVQITPPAGAVGDANFLTRADVANLTASATDKEDGDLAAGVTWLSTKAGDVAPATLGDGAHTLIATARDSNDSADSALLRVHVVPGFEGWAEDLALPDDPLLDHDGDGRTLLEEYATGELPTRVEVEADTLVLILPARAEAIDVRYWIDFSTDLNGFSQSQSWTPLGDTFSGGPVIDLEDGRFELQGTSPNSGAQRSFGRFRIEKP